MNHSFIGNLMASYRLYLLNGQVYFQMGDINYAMTDSGCAQIRTVNTISSNEWHDVVAVRIGNNAANFKIYVDGILQATEIAGYPAMKVAGGDVYNEYGNRYVIGNGSGSGYYANNFTGYIKNLRVYKQAVTPAVVLSNYNSCTSSADTTGLVLWSKIDEGTSTTVIDYSSYHTNGALELIGFGGGVGAALAGSCTTNDTLSVLCKTRTVTGSKVSGYRYGFNGQEKSNEIKGEGNQIDFKYRGYDPRVGRFLSVDPMFKEFPFYSSYQFASNNPILAVDLEGLESSNIKNKTETKSSENSQTAEKKKILDPKTVGVNAFGSNYIGLSNPKNTDGTDSYVPKPQESMDGRAKRHDLGSGFINARSNENLKEDGVFIIGGLSDIAKAGENIVIPYMGFGDFKIRPHKDPYTNKPISITTVGRASVAVPVLSAVSAFKIYLRVNIDPVVNVTVNTYHSTVDFVNDVKNKTQQGLNEIINWGNQPH